MSWDLQTRYDATGLQIPRTEAKEIWAKEEPVAYEKFMQWSEGRTGFPWIVSVHSNSFYDTVRLTWSLTGCSDETVDRKDIRLQQAPAAQD